MRQELVALPHPVRGRCGELATPIAEPDGLSASNFGYEEPWRLDNYYRTIYFMICF